MVEDMVTQSDLLAAVVEALEAALAEGDSESSALRTIEICKELGLSRGRVTEFLHTLQDAGRLDETTKLIRRLGGGVARVPAYRLRRETTDGEMDG